MYGNERVRFLGKTTDGVFVLVVAIGPPDNIGLYIGSELKELHRVNKIKVEIDYNSILHITSGSGSFYFDGRPTEGIASWRVRSTAKKLGRFDPELYSFDIFTGYTLVLRLSQEKRLYQALYSVIHDDALVRMQMRQLLKGEALRRYLKMTPKSIPASTKTQTGVGADELFQIS